MFTGFAAVIVRRRAADVSGLQRLTFALALTLALALGVALPRARGAELKGVTLPDRVTVPTPVTTTVAAPTTPATGETADAGGTVSLGLRGIALLKYKLIFNGYVSGLYLPADVQADAVLTDVPKRLVFHYFWDIDGTAFAPAAEPILQRQFTAAELREVRSGIDAMSRLYVDIRDGEEYSLTYIPGLGTELAKNGKPLGTVPGAAFAAVYFAIWLGPKPLDAGLREALLGK